MLPLYFIAKPVLWVLPWILQSIGYAGILNKAGEKRAWALFPVLAEWRLSRLLFKDIRSFVHPLIVTCVLLGFRFYYSPVGSSVPDFLTMNVVLFGMAAAVVYGLFLIRFYYRLGRAFGKGVPYSIALTIFPLILLIHLGYSKAVFTKPVFPESKIINTPWKRHLYNFVRMLGMAALVAAIVAGSGYYTLQTYPPRLYVEYDILRGFRDYSKQVPAEGKIITREEMMGDAYANLAAMPTSRDKFFPDHSKDEKVVILQYAVGSNLEASYGLLSANLSDQLKATESTDDLTIVTQAGGSTRWFTKGIEDRSVGRYTIQSGEIKKVQSLDPETGMSDPKTFRDFLSWAVKEYPADRYMLFLWDHGGGFTTGYGQDVLNPRTSTENPYGTLTTHDIVKAVEKTGIKFDLIGFDACLMQDIEVGYVLEPYADYYLASEETEGGFGWCYSHGIKALAEDPSLPTEDFAKIMITTFDNYNTTLADGKKDKKSTLSLVDLTRVKPAYEQLMNFYAVQKEAIANDPQDFTDIAVAANDAYTFTGDFQIDLIDYLTLLDQADYDQSIGTSQQKQDLINAIKASVLYRNHNSGAGINGMAFTFPYKSYEDLYEEAYNQYKAFRLDEPESFYNDYFSIMLAQHFNLNEQESKPDKPLSAKKPEDYPWYQKGFEDYIPQTDVTDIALQKTEDGYTAVLDENVRPLILEQEQGVYLQQGKERLYLGADSLGAVDAQGNRILQPDGKAMTINGVPIAYTEVSHKKTKKGIVYRASTRALLNGEEHITLNIEWDPIREGETELTQGHITGYTSDEDTSAFMQKGTQTLQSGGRLQFLFHTYDKDGNFKKEKPAGDTVRVRTQDRLTVEKQAVSGDLYYGLVLTDSFQRQYMTQLVEYKQ